ncbi:MAG: hypothetical protein GY754_36160 [bacterium]|nr:hypothetical protein [bacterium]
MKEKDNPHFDELPEESLNYRQREGNKGEAVFFLLDNIIDFNRALMLGRVLDTFIESNTRNIIVDMRKVKETDLVVWSVLSVTKMNQNNKGYTLQVTNFDVPDLVKKEWEIND